MRKEFYTQESHPNFVIGNNERRYHTSGHGKSTEMITCPFCEKETMAYTWSLSGSGKKCEHCKNVVHTTIYSRKKFKTAEEAQAFVEEHKGE